MKSVFYILVVIVAVSFLAGCSREDDAIQATLDNAERLMEDAPDSALALMESIDPASLKTDRGHALHALLLPRARYKNYIDETDDSLINIAVNYFTANGDEHRFMMALFQKGYICNNAQKRGEAVINYLEAEKLAVKLNDYLYAGLSNREIAEIYNTTYNCVENLKYAQRSYDYFWEVGDREYILWATLILAAAHSNNGNYRKCEEMAKMVVDTAIVMKNDEFYCEAMKLMANSYYAQTKYEKAIECFNKIEAKNPDFLSQQDYSNWGTILVEQNRIKEALSLFKGHQPKDSLKPFVPYQLYLSLNDSANAFEALKREYLNTYDLFCTSIEQSVTSILANHNEAEGKMHAVQIAQMRRVVLFILIIAVLIIVIIVLLYRIRTKLQKQRLKEQIIALEGLSNSFELLMKQNGKQKELIDNMFGDAFHDMNRLCMVYHEYKGSSKELLKMGMEAKKIIDGLALNEQRNKYLEEYINKYQGGLIEELKSMLPKLRDADLLLFEYIAVGFSPIAICVLMNEKIENIYNKKSRLKSKIQNSLSPRKSEILGLLTK